MAQTQASVLRDWDIDELLYLQTTSNIIGIPLSHLLRFAGTCHDGVRFQAPNVATTTSSREWTGGELVALQEAARILSIYLPSLLSFAETSSQQASSGDLPIAQNVSFSSVDVQHPLCATGDTFSMYDAFSDVLDNSHVSSSSTENRFNPFFPTSMNETLQHGNDTDWSVGLDASGAPELDYHTPNTVAEESKETASHIGSALSPGSLIGQNLPRLYFQITDIALFRTTSGPTSQRPYQTLTIDCPAVNAVYSVLAINPSPVIDFKITQGFGTYLQLSACQFDSTLIPEASSSQLQDLYAHNYAIADLSKARVQIWDFILKSVVPYVWAKITPGDFISSSIFSAACNRVKDKVAHHEFLFDALCLWTAARTIEGGWRFVDAQPLGLSPVNGNAVSLTASPLLDYQFAAIMVQDILLPLRDRVLRQLQRLTYSSNSANWFTVFLGNFILLNSYGLLSKQQSSFARRQNWPYRYSMMSLIKDIHHGSRTLLAHFHHICKGQQPFELDWEQGPSATALQGIAQLSNSEVSLMMILSTEIRGKASELEKLVNTDEFESDLWFTGQVFVRDWRPAQTIAEPQARC